MEKKAYKAPAILIHSLKIDNILLIQASQTLQPEVTQLNASGIRMGTQTALSKGFDGPIFDDDYDDDEYDF